MKLSIITINFNNLAGLKLTVESVVKQTFADYEYIIIDGGSSDGSKEFISENEYKVTHWISENDNGIYHAMNKGIKIAGGEYLLFLNSGDIFYSDQILNTIIQENTFTYDLVYGNLLLQFEDNATMIKVYPEKLNFSHFFTGSLPHPATFIKRTLFEKSGFYNEEYKIVSDWEFWLRVLFIEHATYLHIPTVISIFDTGGISSKEEYLGVQLQERELILEKLFPGFVDDYSEFQKFKTQVRSNFFVRVLKKMKLLKL